MERGTNYGKMARVFHGRQNQAKKKELELLKGVICAYILIENYKAKYPNKKQIHY